MPKQPKKPQAKAKKPTRPQSKPKQVSQPAPDILPDVSKKIIEEFGAKNNAVESKPADTKTQQNEQKQLTRVKPNENFIPAEYPLEKENINAQPVKAVVYSILFIWAVGIWMYFIYNSQQPQPPSRVVPTAAPVQITLSPTLVPSNTPAQINTAEYSIAILNGSRRAGVAGQLKKRLEDAGYKVVYTGNAKTSQKNSSIYRAAGVPEEIVNSLNAFIPDTKESYLQPDIEAAESAQLIITVGSDFK